MKMKTVTLKLELPADEATLLDGLTLEAVHPPLEAARQRVTALERRLVEARARVPAAAEAVDVAAAGVAAGTAAETALIEAQARAGAAERLVPALERELQGAQAALGPEQAAAMAALAREARERLRPIARAVRQLVVALDDVDTLTTPLDRCLEAAGKSLPLGVYTTAAHGLPGIFGPIFSHEFAAWRKALEAGLGQ